MDWPTITLPCDFCGKDVEVMVIDGHVTHCHICNECFKNIFHKELEKEKK